MSISYEYENNMAHSFSFNCQNLVQNHSLEDIVDLCISKLQAFCLVSLTNPFPFNPPFFPCQLSHFNFYLQFFFSVDTECNQFKTDINDFWPYINLQVLRFDYILYYYEYALDVSFSSLLFTSCCMLQSSFGFSRSVDFLRILYNKKINVDQIFSFDQVCDSCCDANLLVAGSCESA